MSDVELAKLEGRMTAHEAVCAERWGAIRARVSRIEALGWTILVTMVTGGLSTLAFVAWFFFTKSMHLS